MVSNGVKSIVLTRDIESNAAWGAHLESLGFQVYSLPTIETIPLELTHSQKDAIKHLPDYDWLMFTSAKSVRYFISILSQHGVTWPPEKPLVAAIGIQTARLIEKRGIRVSFKPSRSNSVTFGNELTPVNGTHILFPHTDIASDDLATQLARRGGKVSSLSIYTTRLVEGADEAFLHRLAAAKVDVLVFASPSAVHGFSLRVTDPALLQEAKLIPSIAIGPSTESTLRKAEFKHIYTSRIPTLAGIVEVLQRLVSQ
jgi:uroporphyrinogen-III synthase